MWDVLGFGLCFFAVGYVMAWLLGIRCPGVGEEEFQGWKYRFTAPAEETEPLPSTEERKGFAAQSRRIRIFR
ncbi:hypothetical protein EON81_18305 [bacterium]|nr:MAG: hypothetical protein EON81_18305 [bacterium]